MIKNAKYVHTNLIAADWRKLAKFYVDVLGCETVQPERDFSGKEIEAGTGIKGVRLTGMHLRLPGYNNNGPTLEIFSYYPEEEMTEKKVNRPGFGHIAFLVEDVESARDEILNAGGKFVGDIVTVQLTSGEKIKWCYVTDPEGNIIELQTKS